MAAEMVVLLLIPIVSVVARRWRLVEIEERFMVSSLRIIVPLLSSIVGRALLRVTQNDEGFVDGLEFRLGLVLVGGILVGI